MSFPSKKDRQACWSSRDRFWECLDANNVEAEQPSPPACEQLKKMFESSCPAQWVKHFNRKRDYELFKSQLETQGYIPTGDNETNTNLSIKNNRKQKPFKQMMAERSSVH